MKAPSLALMLVIGTFALTACDRNEERDEKAAQRAAAELAADALKRAATDATAPDPATQARRQLVAWLECEECVAGELNAVVKLGPMIVPSLAATLREGPSAAAQQRMRQHLAATHREYADYWARHRHERPEEPRPPPPREFEKMFLDNYIARYRLRSARALGEIGGDDARRALEEAFQDQTLRYDVRNAVSEALQKLRSEPAARTAAWH